LFAIYINVKKQQSVTATRPTSQN